MLPVSGSCCHWLCSVPYIPMSEPNTIRIITDGACRGNPGPGGWAALIIDGEQRKEIGGFVAQTTNNRMELTAVIEALQHVPAASPTLIVSDSSYVIEGATKWIKGWRVRDWMTRDDKPVENRDLWETLDSLLDEQISWEQVRGHAGHPENERANQLAQWYAAGGRGRPPLAPPVQASRSIGTASTAKVKPFYLSLVAGQLARHASWDECNARVHGVSGARYKKVTSQAEAQAVLLSWGLAEDAMRFEF